MSDDPLSVPKNSAMHASPSATVRARKFLTEYVGGPGRAEAETLADVLARLQATRADLSTQSSALFSRALADLGKAIERISGTLTADAGSPPDVYAAVEIVQDVAMALRQRNVESVFCDALDAAISEIGDAVVRNEAAQTRVQGAALHLRELARHVAGMAERSAPSDAVERLDDTADRPLADIEDRDPARRPREIESLPHGLLEMPASGLRSRSENQAELNSPMLPSSAATSGDVEQSRLEGTGVSAPRKGDPFAALRALSEEELIALFG